MENYTDLTLVLKRLEESSRKQVLYVRLQFIFSLVTALCCGLVLFVAVKYLPDLLELISKIQNMAAQLHDLASQAESVMTNLESVTDVLANTDLKIMVDNMNSLVISSQDGIAQTMEKLNAIDFDALNKAIANLSAVVEPLANFFKVFN